MWEASIYHPHLQIELPSINLEILPFWRKPLRFSFFEPLSVFCYKLTFSHGVYVTGSHRPQALVNGSHSFLNLCLSSTQILLFIYKFIIIIIYPLQIHLHLRRPGCSKSFERKAKESHFSSLESCTYNGMDVTVVDRQQATYPLELCASSVPQFQSYLGSGPIVELKRPEAYLGGDGFHEFVYFPVGGGPEFGDSEKLNLVLPDAALGYCVSRTSSCQMTAFHAAAMKEGREDMVLEKMESTTGSGSRDSFTKRKAEVSDFVFTPNLFTLKNEFISF